MTRLWLDPSFGASGDMLLGALLGLRQSVEPDAVDALVAALGALAVDGWELSREQVTRGGITATRVHVRAEPGPARHWSDIDRMLAAAPLPARVVDGARRTFRLLGEVEAAQHDVELDDVHFHEVGAVDAIVDVVGAWWLLDRLGVDDVVVGPVGIGHGTVTAAHGALPIPAPATLELLRGAPVRSLAAPFETCTPTGAALVVSMGTWGPLPDGTIVGNARGAGGKDPATHPNVLSAILLDTDPADDGTEAEPAVVISTNVDDVSPEVLGHLVDVLLQSGADDAWIVPIVMKKGRPAHQVCVLASPHRVATLRAVVASETGSLGLRTTAVTKFVAPRRTETVTVRGTAVRVKVGPHGAKPEHDDLVALSVRDGVPIRTLAAEAVAEWRARG